MPLDDKVILDSIIEVSPVGIVIAAPDGKITYANRQAEEILGLTRDEITQRTYNAPSWHITDVNGDHHPDETLPFRQVMLERRLVRDIQHAIEWPDGTRRILSISGAPILNGSGEVLSLVFSVDDVTLRRQMEEDLKSRLKIEELIGRIALSAVKVVSVSSFLNSVLADIGETLSLSRVTILELDWTEKTLVGHHQWRAKGVVDTTELWNKVFSFDTLPILSDPSFEKAPLIFEDIESVPVHEFRNLLRSIDTKSIVIFPIMLSRMLHGVLVFETVGQARKWSPETVRLLDLGARMIAQVIECAHAKEAIAKSEDKSPTNSG